MVIHLILGVDGDNIIDYLPLEALTTANALNAPRQVLFSFMAGFFSSPKRVVQVVSIQTSSTGFYGHVAFDVRKQGSGGFTFDIASNRIQRTLPVFLCQLSITFQMEPPRLRFERQDAVLADHLQASLIFRNNEHAMHNDI